MIKAPIVVVLDDRDQAARQVVADGLRGTSATLHSTNDSGEAVSQFSGLGARIVLMSAPALGPGTLAFLEQFLAADPDVEVVVAVTDYSEKLAVAAIKRGASDVLRAPLSPEVVAARIRPLVLECEQRRGINGDDLEPVHRFEFEGMIGRSPVMLDLFTRIQRVAPHLRSALVCGPAGSGKELAARALHALSTVSDGRFGVCDCVWSRDNPTAGSAGGGIAETARNEQEPFGRPDRGTLFLDEVSDLSLDRQAVLVRILESNELPLREHSQSYETDLRVLAATSKDLQSYVKAGTFREDLYFRLTAISLDVPPLRDRKEDIPLLVRHFLRHLAKRFQKRIRGLTRRAQIALARHSWPGNVRELENVLAQACLMAEGEVIDVHHLPLSRGARATMPTAATHLISLRDAQRRHAEQVLSVLGGNKARAAEVLAISRARLYRLLAGPSGT